MLPAGGGCLNLWKKFSTSIPDAVTDVDIGDRVSVRGWFASGGFAEYVVANVDYLKVPASMSAEDGALLEMGAAVWLMAEQVLRTLASADPLSPAALCLPAEASDAGKHRAATDSASFEFILLISVSPIGATL